MDPKVDFIAEMEAAIGAPNTLCGVDVFRIANNLSVKLGILLESRIIEGISVHKIRRPTPWSITTYEMTTGLGHEVTKQSWRSDGKHIVRTIENASLEYTSLDTRELVLCSVPGVSRILEDSDRYRLYVTHHDLFSNTNLKFSDWRNHQLLKIDTMHMIDRSAEDAYRHYLKGLAPQAQVAKPASRQSPSITVTYTEIILWYRNLSGAHSAATKPHQLIAEKLPSGEFFVRPLYFVSRKEYFRAILGLQSVRKIVAVLVILLAAEVYATLTSTTYNAACWLDCPKLMQSDSCDITTITCASARRGDINNDLIRRVENIAPFVDERYRGHYIGFFPYDPPVSGQRESLPE